MGVPGANNNYDIDPVTGTITRDSPQATGEYNIAFRVYEWRRVGSGTWVNVGWVTRDMQVTVVPCTATSRRDADVADTCVEAGTFLTFPVQASDPDAGQNVTWTRWGNPSWWVVVQPRHQSQSRQPGHGHLQLEHQLQPCAPAALPGGVQRHGQRPAGAVAGLFHDEHHRGGSCAGEPIRHPVARRSTCSGTPASAATSPATRSPAQRLLFVPGPARNGCAGLHGLPVHRQHQRPEQHHVQRRPGLINRQRVLLHGGGALPGRAETIRLGGVLCHPDRQVPGDTHVSVGETDPATGIDTVRWSNACDLDTVARPRPTSSACIGATGSARRALDLTPARRTLPGAPGHLLPDTGLDTRAVRTHRVGCWATRQRPDRFGHVQRVFIVPDPDDEQITPDIQHNTPGNTTTRSSASTGCSSCSSAPATTPTYTDTGLVNGRSTATA